MGRGIHCIVAVVSARACARTTVEGRLVPGEGIEPPTFGLQNRCTTAVLTRPCACFRRTNNRTRVILHQLARYFGR